MAIIDSPLPLYQAELADELERIGSSNVGPTKPRRLLNTVGALWLNSNDRSLNINFGRDDFRQLKYALRSRIIRDSGWLELDVGTSPVIDYQYNNFLQPADYEPQVRLIVEYRNTSGVALARQFYSGLWPASDTEETHIVKTDGLVLYLKTVFKVSRFMDLQVVGFTSERPDQQEILITALR